MEIEVEHTDTFGGEANYSWVTRKTLNLNSGLTDVQIVRASKKALGLTGVKCKKSDMGETIRLDLAGCAQVVFITPKY